MENFNIVSNFHHPMQYVREVKEKNSTFSQSVNLDEDYICHALELWE